MILAIIQARMSSTRLPGKVLRKIAGKPMLQWVVEAALDAKHVDEVVVATSECASDDGIDDFCDYLGVSTCRGSLEDVLDRVYWTALCFQASHIVRLTGDCPMLDPDIIDGTILEHLRGGYDYTCNFIAENGERLLGTDGQDVEVFTMDSLVKAAHLATTQYEREHVTPYIRANFTKGYSLEYPLRGENLSVDTEEDFKRVEEEMQCQSLDL